MSTEALGRQLGQHYLTTHEGTRPSRCADCGEAITVIRTKYFTRSRGGGLVTGLVETAPDHECRVRRGLAS